MFGGTFNPIHLGHLLIAQDAIDAFELTSILFMPCATPPHKQKSSLIPARHRLAMVEAAIEADINFEPSDLEIQRGGVSYSYVTMSEIRQLHPDTDILFIIGSDSLCELHLWKNIYKLLDICELVIIERPGYERKTIDPASILLDPPWPDKLLANIVSRHPVGISSTDVRYRIAEGMCIRHLVPRAVEVYIAEHRLYRPFRSE